MKIVKSCDMTEQQQELTLNQLLERGKLLNVLYDIQRTRDGGVYDHCLKALVPSDEETKTHPQTQTPMAPAAPVATEQRRVGATEQTGAEEMTKLDLRETFLALWKQLGTDAKPTSEHRFHPVRKWRFDVAFPEHHLAIECEGGVWTGGRHTRGAGFTADIEKYNTATCMGWRILRYTAADFRKRPVQVIEEVASLLVRS